MEKAAEADPNSHASNMADPEELPRLEHDKETAISGDAPSRDLSVTEKQEGEPEEEFISGFKLGIVLTAITLTCFLMLLDTSIIGTAIPSITTEFHSLPDVGWYGAAYLLANCALQPLAGKFYTYFKSSWTFIAFTFLFELGSLLCGVAPNSNALIVGRAVAGLGTAGIMNGGITIIAHCVPLSKRPLLMGMMMSCAQIGVLLGPLIGGALTQHVSWRWCFYINLPPGAAVIGLLFFISIPDKRVKDENRKWNLRTIFSLLDIVGFLLFAPATVMFLLALEWGGITFPWNSATVIGLFCGSVGTLAVFLGWEYHRGDNAMIPFSMLTRTAVWSSCLVLFFFLSSMLLQSYYLPIYFQTARDATPTLSGVYLLPSILSQIIFAGVSGAFVTRTGYVVPWAAASGVLAAVGSGLLSSLTPTSSTGTWIGYQILAGSGRGLGIQMPLIQIQNVLPPAQISVAMSLAVFSQTFGGALFLSFAETIFTTGLKDALPQFAPEVNVAAIIAAGASGVRNVVSPASLPGVILAYNTALQHVFYLSTGAAAATFFFCWGMGWKNIKKEKKVTPEA